VAVFPYGDSKRRQTRRPLDRERITRVAIALLDQVGLRDAARVMAETAPMGPRRRRHVESALRIFVSAGFSKRDAVRIACHFNNLVTELAAAEARLRVSEAEY
jgi:hypothetical protein